MYHVVTQASSKQPEAPFDSEPGGRQPPPQPTEDSKDARKERVLHTRVPAVLEQELKRFAENLRVPVSNLVRTILEDAVSVADAATESVEERLRSAARHLEKERERLRKRIEHDPLDGVIAFQEVTLAAPTACVKCSRPLPRGARAHLSIGEGPYSPRVFVCEECKPS